MTKQGRGVGFEGSSRCRNAYEQELARRLTRAESADAAVEVFALIAGSVRAVLLRMHRPRAVTPWDLEDAFQQAVSELAGALLRGDRAFASFDHAVNALEQRFVSRLTDNLRWRRRRGQGLGQLELSVAGVEAMADHRLPEEAVFQAADRAVLLDVIQDLSEDEQRWVVCRSLNLERTEACARLGWETERYKSIAKRAMPKIGQLLEANDRGERCRRLAPHLEAFVAGTASGRDEVRVRAHLRACGGCRHDAAELRAAVHGIGALLPMPWAAGAAETGVRAVEHLATTVRLRLGGLVGRGVRGPNGEAVLGTGTAAGGGLAAGKVGLGLCSVLALGTAGVCLNTDLLRSPAPRHPPTVTRPTSGPARAGRPSAPATPAPSKRAIVAAVPVASGPIRVAATRAARTPVRSTASRVATTSTTRSAAPPAQHEFGIEGGTSSTSAPTAPVAPSPAAAPTATSAATPAAPSTAGRTSSPAPSAAAEFSP